jgi:hypothetical protein
MSSRSSGREPGPDPDLEDIAWLAAEIGAAPIAVVGLIEGQAATFRPAAGVGAGRAMGASAAGLALAVARHGATLVVPDLDSDARFAKDPVTDPPLQARAFAGVPMQAAGDAALGVVLLFDLEPRPFLPWQVRAIERLAGLASRRLQEARDSRARDRRREHTLDALAGGLALEIQALQQERGAAGGGAGEGLSRAAALARDLLALLGHRSLRPAAVDLNALVAERAARAAEACGRRLDIRLDGSIGPVAADGERLGRAIAGLVSRAAPPSGAYPDEALCLATSEVAIAAGPSARIPAGRYVLLTIGAPQGAPMEDDPLRGWSFDAGTAPGLSETHGMLRQGGARLGTAPGAAGLPAFCIALPRAAD